MKKIVRIYCRVSTAEQDLARQEALADKARAAGYYVAKVYAEKASGTLANRPVLNELIEDLQAGDVVMAENIDRISRLPLPEAEKLIARIAEKGARLSVPNILDLSDIDIQGQSEIGKIVLDSLQQMLLKIALQVARDEYETRRERTRQGRARARAAGRGGGGRKANYALHRRIFELRINGISINKTAELCQCSTALVKNVKRQYKTLKDIPNE